MTEEPRPAAVEPAPPAERCETCGKDIVQDVRGVMDGGWFHVNPSLNDLNTHRARPATASPAPSSAEVEAEAVARLFHETYERLAPSFGYETRKASAVPWEDVPENNRRLMIAVAGEVSRAIRKEYERVPE